MSNRFGRLLVIPVTVFSITSATRRDPSYGPWQYQSPGVYWQLCVYDNGSRHCFQATDANGSNSKEISCS